ncbi:amidohydrolase family protein [Balneola vulgaris]|uniref:amidohydrolase family protein n=1 Tax=Balneola vulgaris TaxID=287535 RepID=UPI0003657313|nr:amidohydrolase family protein [Balneola vulgaris]
MKRLVFSAAILSLLLLAFVIYNNNEEVDNRLLISGEATAFTNVNVVPMTSSTILENKTVVIRGNEIIMIRPTGELKMGKGVSVIDGTDKYLMPGLAEMHGHVPPTDPPANAPRYMTKEYVENTLFLYTAAGVTTVRGMLGWPDQLQLKDKILSQELIGPQLFLAGPSFNGNSINSVEEAREKVRAQNEEGWDLLKIHPGLTLEEYDAMAATANEVGIRFGGHVPSDVGIVHVLEAGQNSIDHMDGYVAYLSAFEGAELDEKMDELIQLTLENDVWIVPTQALWETIIGSANYDVMKTYEELKYIPKNLLSGYNAYVENKLNSPNYDLDEAKEHSLIRRMLLGKMNEAGVRILLGTDAPQLFSVPGFSIHREMVFMAEAGMSPYEILVTGTRNVGEYFQNEADFGTIEEGKRADLILLDKNPLDSIINLKAQSGVMVNGKWLPKDFIEARLFDIQKSYQE